MSKLIENKNIIHIATEIVTIFGVIFYFSSKNKKLLEHIEDLSQRLEDQEDLIQKHEQIIKQLVISINKNNITTKKKQLSPKPVIKNIIKRKKESSVPVTIEEEEESSEEENNSKGNESSDLDADLVDELQELEQQDGLKQRN
jgi:hypothetical protein